MQHLTAIEIDAPPSAVWNVLGNVREWPRWLPTVQAVTPLDPSAPDAVGAAYQVRQPRLPKAVWVISDYDADSGFTWRSTSPGITSTGIHELEDLGGRTLVTLGVDWAGPLAPVLGLFYGRLTQRYIETEAASLKATVEGG
jgi:hypothetical protein